MIRVESLGGLRIFVGGTESATLAKQRLKSGLLVFLAVERSCMRESLIATFWPDRDPERARHALSQNIYELRKQLGEDWLAITGDRLTISDQVECDAVQFIEAVERGDLTQAFGLYRGRFLEGCYLAETRELEEWIDRRADRITKLLRRALRETCEQEPLPDWVDAAIDAASRATEQDPSDDEAQHALIHLLAWAGRRSDALKQYEKYESALRDDELEPLDNTKQLIASIRSDPGAGLARAPVISAPVTGAPPVAWPPDGTTTRARRAPIVAGLVVVGLAALLPSVISRGSRQPDPVEQSSDLPRLAILYFDDNSPDGDIGYVAKGITETLIGQLGVIPQFRVLSKNAVAPYRDGKLGTDSIAKLLHAEFVVTGTVTRSGDRFRVSFEVVNGQNGDVINAAPALDRAWADYFPLIDSVGAEILEILKPLIGEQITVRALRADTRSAEAWDLYQRGRQDEERAVDLLNHGEFEDAARAFERADSLLGAAETRDRAWPEATVARGHIALERALLGLLARHPPEEFTVVAQLALKHADAALRRKAQYVPALELRGTAKYRMTMVQRDTAAVSQLVSEAQRDLESAVQLDPRRAEAWSLLSAIYYGHGDFQRSFAAAQSAEVADSYLKNIDEIYERLALSAFELGQDRQAKQWCDRGRTRFTDNLRFIDCALTLMAWSDSLPAQPDSAWALVASIPGPEPLVSSLRPFREMLAAGVLIRVGQADSARRVMMRARQTAPAHDAMLWAEAANQVRLGDHARAIQLLNEFVANNGAQRSVLLSRAFQPLRSVYTYRALLRR